MGWHEAMTSEGDVRQGGPRSSPPGSSGGSRDRGGPALEGPREVAAAEGRFVARPPLACLTPPWPPPPGYCGVRRWVLS
jgi:hypothetical protein